MFFTKIQLLTVIVVLFSMHIAKRAKKMATALNKPRFLYSAAQNQDMYIHPKTGERFSDPTSLQKDSRYILRDGNTMPVLGFGCYRIKPGYESQGAVATAIDAGYRHIDTAALYGNEGDVAVAVKHSEVDRKDIFITTKLWIKSHGRDNALKAFEKSLEKLDSGYVDLYLMHAPSGGKLLETWDAILEAKKRGLAKSVGVSNFNVHHLQALEQSGKEMPVVNQIELHPMIWKERENVLDYCREKGILVVAYGSLFSGQMQFMSDPAVKNAQETATLLKNESKGVTASQALLRWAVQMGFAVIPKSVTETRIEENAEIWHFALTDSAIQGLNGMKGELHEYWNPLESEASL